MTGAVPRKTPCASCPYRKNVPSGVWHETQYDLLPGYDGETMDQTPRPFFCHQSDGQVCSGWLGHTDASQLLAVRLGILSGNLDPSCADYSTPVPLFASGAEAAAHGMAEIENPSDRAEEFIEKIVRKRGGMDEDGFLSK